MQAKKRKTQRGRFIQTIAYLRPDQVERLHATVAHTQVPAARFIRAGLDLVLADPSLVQRPAAEAA